MKKIVAVVLLTGTLFATSCKKEVKADAVKNETIETVDEATKKVESVAKEVKKEVEAVKTEATKMMDSALEGVQIPEFSNPAVTENLKKYATYAKDYIAAKGNTLKLAGLAKTGASLLTEGKTLASKLDASELTKYNSVLSAIKAKM
jgi:hypothetical protein